MYNRGYKGGATRSVNMMSSNQVADKMAATEERHKQRHNDLQENQCKIVDWINQIVSSDISIRGDGGIPPVIETKSLGKATMEGGTDLSRLMAQTQENQQALVTAIGNLPTNCQRNNFNNNSANDTVTTKPKPTVEANYYRR